MPAHRMRTTCAALLLLGASTHMPAMASAQDRPAVPSDTLRLRPGDVVRVTAWREPQYSGDFPVDERGIVTLPMVGPRVVTATTWGALRDSLLMQYRTSLSNEAVALVPLRRVYVLGAVLRPGIYMLEPSVGMEGAVALAGGASTEGTLDRIRIIRDGRAQARNLSVTRDAGQYPLASGDQVFVERRSWIDRNSALLLSSFVSLAGVIAILVGQ